MIRENEVKADLKKYRIYWIVMLVLFTIFAIVLVRTVNKSNEQELAEISKTNVIAAQREVRAEVARDSAKTELKVTNAKLLELEKQLTATNTTLLRMENSFSNSYLELTKLKLNEKEFTNINASPSEQLMYVSEYKHTEY